MKVLKPDWINHNGHPIFSIDIHPDGSRLATGGQGEDSGRVIIWNMAPIVQETEENNESVPKMLCQLDNHLACVNCVRWSGSGKYLASGGDDKLVMVWSISKNSGANSIFGSGAVNVEGWRCMFTLRAHQGDILDMAWAPHDHYLATCSVDNTIIIWRPDNFPEIVQVLKGHTGLVKGVSWDPVGKYLSSQSDDKTVRIWRTVDWSEEKVISEPFEQCSGTTMVLRLSWSPDGQYLITAHAMNGSGPTAKIIDRDGWSSKRDIVGHRKAVTCVRYSRKLTEKERSKGKVSQSSTCAVGSRDRGVSVWMCSSPRPLVVIEDLFSSPVLDLAWGPVGNSLMACSGDGTIAFIEFSAAEIGRPLTEIEKDSVLERLYGKCDLLEAGDGLRVVENPSFLSVFSSAKELKNSQTKNVVTNGVSQSNTQSSKPPTTTTQTTTKQIETRTSDGRRRITPIFIPMSQENNEEVVPFSSDTMPSFSSCQKSRIIVERRDDVVVVPNVTPVKLTPNTANTSSMISLGSTPNTDFPSPSVTESGGFTGLVNMADKIETQKDKDITPKKSTTKISRKAKRRKLTDDKEENGITRPHALLPALPVSNTSVVKLLKTNNFVRIENGVHKNPNGNVSVIKLEAPDESKPIWEIVLGSEVVSCVGTESVIALATLDHTLRLVTTKAGDVVLPPIALGAPASVLKLSSGYLLVVTTTGRLSVWALSDTSRPRALLSNEDVLPLAPTHTGGETRIKECFVSKAGEPLLAFSSGKAYFHSKAHNAWLLIGNHNDPVNRGAQAGYRNTQRSSSPTGDSFPLKSIQTAALNGLSVGGGLGRGVGPTSELAPLCTLGYLDSQLSSSLAIGSQQEYKFWLLAQARFLVQRGLENRLKLLCESLLGPMYSSSSKTRHSTWTEDVLGLKKHSLLEEILDEAKGNVKLQRLVTEMKEQLTAKSAITIKPDVLRRLVLGTEDVPRLLKDCASELCTEDPNQRALISLQAVYTDHMGGAVQENGLRKRYLRPLERTISELSPTSRQDLLHLTDLIAGFAVLYTGLGSPTASGNLHDTRGALDSFLSLSDLDRFCSAGSREKIKMLAEISDIAGGIRLFNKHRGKPANGDFDDYPGLLSEYIQETQRLFGLHLEECRDRLAPVHKLMAGRFPSRHSPTYLSAVRALLVKQQVIAYIKVMFLSINELAVDFEKCLTVYTNILEEIYVQTEHRYAVPTKTIHPLFIKLSITYMEFFKGIATLSDLEQLLYKILQYFQFDDSVDGLLEMLGDGTWGEEEPDEERCADDEEDMTGYLDKINPALIKSKHCRLVFAEKNHFDKLEYNGYDPVCPLLAGGLLLEAQPQIGMLHFQEALVGFSSPETAYIFAEDPQRYHQELVAFVRLNPHYIDIFLLNEDLQHLSTNEDRCVERKRDAEVQTEVHP